MNPDQRAQLEAKAERLLRRGEMSAALGLLRQVAAAFPDEEGPQLKVASLEANLLPEERQGAQLPPSERPISGSDPRIEHAERMAARGDFAAAIALYRGALKQRPDNELLQERLAELFSLAQQMPAPGPRPTPTAPEDVLQALLERISARRRD